MNNYSTLFSSLIVALSFTVSTAHAQSVAWTQRVVSGPSRRAYMPMVYDVARGVIVVFGGAIVGGGSNETWEWNGITWTLRSSSGPSPRHQSAMTYDTTRSITVLFGGHDDQTWEWNGTAWTQRMVAGPSNRYSHAMAYDSARGVTVFFGGFDDHFPIYHSYSDTWEWNGTVWTQRMVSGPTARYSHAMAYDSARGVTVLFGGNTDSGLSGETWEWNGTIWTQQMVSGPSPREGHELIYDAARGVTVLFGGHDINNLNAETWEWNGNAWNQRAIGVPPSTMPSPRESHAMVYDSVRGVTVLFGGNAGDGYNGETWELGTFCALAAIGFTQHPSSASVPPLTTATFSIAARSTASLTYQWRRNGSNLANAPTGTGSVTTGVDTPTLTISYASLADNGSAFDCIVSNACGSKQSNPAGLAVVGRCPADFNQNGSVTIDDIFIFLNAWFAGCP